MGTPSSCSDEMGDVDMDEMILAATGKKTVIAVDRRNSGLSRIASYVARDFRAITGNRPCDIRVAGSEDPDNGASANADVVIVAGILGDEGFIDRLVRNGAIEGKALEGKRESFLCTVLPRKGREIIVVAGSDLVGAEYGLLRLSELAGVSPWQYWADVTVTKREKVTVLREDLDYQSPEPSVRLRGFFLNDEWPSLGNWVHTTFGGFNENFYETVFELLLRLKGNFLWPAMWTGVFSEDGRAYPTASAELATQLGITMGTSHHEPLFRAGEEFSHLCTDSNEIGYGKDWSYYSNERGLYDFWSDGVARNKDYKSLVTIGMRGERDSKILGENATLGDNIELLKKTIRDQKKILRDGGLPDAQKVLALYKEVEDYYYGDSKTEGLATWEELDDVMLLLSDDNFGNLRTLPTAANRDRKAGWGIYYHFDYHGGPISYEWVNSTPITKAWEQLTSAYAYGIKDLWVVNVGDLRPVELPLSYFLSLAYDFGKWSEPNRTREFLAAWTRQQFAPACDEAICEKIEAILDAYTRMNGDRRPEATHPDTFDFGADREAFRELDRASSIEARVEEIRSFIPEERRDAFYGLVEFPAMASANLRRMMILTGWWEKLYAWKASYADVIRERILSCVVTDKELVRRYNEEMSGGKWRHEMSSKHVNFQAWNDEGSEYPAPVELPETTGDGELLVVVEGRDPITEGEAEMTPFSSSEETVREILLLTTCGELPPVEMVASEDWILLPENKDGPAASRIEVRVDATAITENRQGFVILRAGDREIRVRVKAVAARKTALAPGEFAESVGVLSIPADAYAVMREKNGASWVRIADYGKNGVAMKSYPWAISYENAGEGPELEYHFHVSNGGDYTVTLFIAPTNNPVKNRGLRTAIRVDDEAPVTLDTLPERFAAGDTDDADWCQYVLDNGRRIHVPITLAEGSHRLAVLAVDAGVVLQKIEIAKETSTSFYGYPFTYDKKEN